MLCLHCFFCAGQAVGCDRLSFSNTHFIYQIQQQTKQKQTKYTKHKTNNSFVGQQDSQQTYNITSIDYYDGTTNDNDHCCQQGIHLAISEIENNSGTTIGDDINNVLVVVQNGPCSDDEATCDDDTLKEQIETLNIRTVVPNFGPNANSNENVCIVTESGEQRYDQEDLLPGKEMNKLLINLVRNRVNEEFGRISIVEYDNDDVPQVILSLNDVPSDDNNRRDTIIQTVIDNVDYCDDSAHPGDENNYCQEGIKAGVMEMMTNGNVGDNSVIIVIQNGECNENPDICKQGIDLAKQEIFDNGNIVTDPIQLPTELDENFLIVLQNDNEDVCENSDFKKDLENVNVQSYVFNFGQNAVKDENDCTVTDNCNILMSFWLTNG